MMILKKKTIIISTLVLLIVAACYVSLKYGNALRVNNQGEDTDLTGIIDDSSDTSTTSNQASGFFIDVKIDRENTRVSQKQQLNSIINNDKTSKEDRSKANEELMTIVDLSGKEMETEALIKAKGFEDALVFLDKDKANVTVKAKSLKPEEANMIKDIVCKQTGYPAAKVTLQTLE